MSVKVLTSIHTENMISFLLMAVAMTLDSWMFKYLSVLHAVKPLKTQQSKSLTGSSSYLGG